MATANYAKTSPYVNTGTFSFFLDVANIPQIPYVASDTPYVIDAIYKNRPDLLAYDLYGDVSLWWVFSVRNPNTIKDPVWDFVSGIRLYLPKQETLTSVLGL